MKNFKLEVFLIIVASILSAIGFKYFLLPLDIIPGGVGGISVFISQTFSINGSTNFLIFIIALWCISAPLYVWSFKKNGALFTLKSLLYTIIFPLVVPLLPQETILSIEENKIFICALGAVFMAYSFFLLYISGASSGGLDLVFVYITKQKSRFSIGKIAAISSWVIIISGTAILSIKFNVKFLGEKLSYSLLTQWLIGGFVLYFYPRHTVAKVSVTTKENNKFIKLLKKEFPHSPYSIFDFESSQKKEYRKFEVILSYYESQELLKKLKEYEIEAFTYQQKVTKIQGRFVSRI